MRIHWLCIRICIRLKFVFQFIIQEEARNYLRKKNI